MKEGVSMKEPLKIKSRQIRDKLFEVEGVIIPADTMTEAIRKWRRAKKECEQ